MPADSRSGFGSGIAILALAAGMVWGATNPSVPGHDPNRVQVLLITGYNSTPNHRWREVDPELRTILEQTGRFEVRIQEEPRGLSAATLQPYKVLVIDYSNYIPTRGPAWPPQTRQAYLDFLSGGGGVVAFHVTAGSFPEWPEFQQSIGIETSRAISHGPYHSFRVQSGESGHPIMAGVPAGFDQWGEIYNGLRLLPSARVLATAFDDPGNCASPAGPCGSGKREPILWTYQQGAGRAFVTTLGHDLRSITKPEFRATFVRGVDWAATGR